MSKVTKSVANLGPPRVTKDHNYLRFILAVLYLFAILVGVGYMAWEGYIHKLVAWQTIWFTLGFGVLLTYGVLRGLRASWMYARKINAIKMARPSSDDLKNLLQVHHLSWHTVQIVGDVLGGPAGRDVEVLERLSGKSAIVGFSGTVIGFIFALVAVSAGFAATGDVTGVHANLPEVVRNMGVALVTTLSGVVVGWVIGDYAALVKVSAEKFVESVLRTLHDHLHAKETNAPLPVEKLE